MSDLTWYRIRNKKSDAAPPHFAYLAMVARGDDGTVFMPAAATGNETLAFLAAGSDGGVPATSYGGHLFLPTWWIAPGTPGSRGALRDYRGGAGGRTGPRGEHPARTLLPT